MERRDNVAVRTLASLVSGRRLSNSEVLGAAPLAKAVLVKTQNATYVLERVVGCGCFGLVLAGTWQEKHQPVALKRVLQDRRVRSRELAVLQQVKHPCIVHLLDSFYSQAPHSTDVYLNVVTERMPCTLHDAAAAFVRRHELFPTVLTKLFVFQLCRALAYLHALGICHRDIKPRNMLCDVTTGEFRLCDFGSAKVLRADEPNIAYICSRYYRAPELLLGCRQYTTAIDIWAAACVLAELYLGHPLFAGANTATQLRTIARMLGTPCSAEVAAMGRGCEAAAEAAAEATMAGCTRTPWSRVFRVSPEPVALALLDSLLVYTPDRRPSAVQLLAHPWFATLQSRAFKLPSGAQAPPHLLQYTDVELEQARKAGIEDKLIGRRAAAEAEAEAAAIAAPKAVTKREQRCVQM